MTCVMTYDDVLMTCVKMCDDVCFCALNIFPTGGYPQTQGDCWTGYYNGKTRQKAHDAENGDSGIWFCIEPLLKLQVFMCIYDGQHIFHLKLAHRELADVELNKRS